jgi:hypothetical protein
VSLLGLCNDRGRVACLLSKKKLTVSGGEASHNELDESKFVGTGGHFYEALGLVFLIFIGFSQVDCDLGKRRSMAS